MNRESIKFMSKIIMISGSKTTPARLYSDLLEDLKRERLIAPCSDPGEGTLISVSAVPHLRGHCSKAHIVTTTTKSQTLWSPFARRGGGGQGGGGRQGGGDKPSHHANPEYQTPGETMTM